jgi:hypothetical protein
VTASPGPLAIVDFVQLAAARTNQNMSWMARIVGDKIAGKQVYRVLASLTVDRLDPEEIFDRNIAISIEAAIGSVGRTNLDRQRLDERTGRPAIVVQIQMLDLLSNDPRCHGIDIETLHITSDPVCLEQRGPAAHEWVDDQSPREVICLEENLSEWLIGKLRKDEPPEQRARPASEPLMNRDDGTIVLLNLLFLERHPCDQTNVELFFDRHRRTNLTFGTKQEHFTRHVKGESD